MHRALSLPAFLALSACAGTVGDYPSLLPRPIEGRSFAEPVRSVPTVAPDSALDSRIVELNGTVAAAQRSFTSTVDAATPRIRSGVGATEGSERWLGAQVALAELDVARAAIDAPVSDLERLAIDRAASGQLPYPALDRALAAATGASRAQRERIDALTASLR